MIEKIKKVLLENPTLSNREIGKIVGLSRNSVQYYLNKLNIHRDRKEQQKLNNTSREKILKISEFAYREPESGTHGFTEKYLEHILEKYLI